MIEFRPKSSDVLRKSKFEIRKQNFKELCLSAYRDDSETSKKEAISYLQHQVAEVVNHEDEEESNQFRLLTMWLFKWKSEGLWGNIATQLSPITAHSGHRDGSQVLIQEEEGLFYRSWLIFRFQNGPWASIGAV